MKPNHADDCNLYPLCRCHVRCIVENGSKPTPSHGFAGNTLVALVARCSGRRRGAPHGIVCEGA